MDVLPAVALVLPNSGFQSCNRGWGTVEAHTLDESGISHHGYVSHEPHLWRAQGRMVPAFHSSQLEIEVVEVHAFHELAHRLRLECRERRIAEFLVRCP